MAAPKSTPTQKAAGKKTIPKKKAIKKKKLIKKKISKKKASKKIQKKINFSPKFNFLILKILELSAPRK